MSSRASRTSSASVSLTIWSWSGRENGFSMSVPISARPKSAQQTRNVAGTVRKPSESTRARGSAKDQSARNRLVWRA